MQQSSAKTRRPAPIDRSSDSKDLAFARKLRHFLSLTNMTNKELAEFVHTGEGTVSRWLHGRQRPCRRRIASLEQLLGLEPGTLQSDEGPGGLGSPVHSQQRAEAHNPCDAAHQVAARDTPARVMLEFNRWLEPYISSGGTLSAVDAADWMQRMWRASSKHAPEPQRHAAIEFVNPDTLLDIDVEPGTGVAITSNMGRLVVVNEALCEMLGLDQDEIVGRLVWELNAPDYRRAGQNRVRQQLTEPWDVELMTGSGERLPVTISNVLCHLGDNTVRVALVKPRGSKSTG